MRMYDAINLNNIPPNPPAVAGYVNGHWPTYGQLKARFPKAKRLSIAVSSSADAECVDVEPSDVPPQLVGGWIRRQQARGVERPVVYCSLANMQALLDRLAREGIKRKKIRVWTAHYSHQSHRCDKGCGFGLRTTADATQWTDKSFGRSLDESLVSETFFTTKKEKRMARKIKLWKAHRALARAARATVGKLNPILARDLTNYINKLNYLIAKNN